MSSRSDLLFIKDIREAIEAINSYLDGVDFAQFDQERMRQSAVIREFEIIGEAVGKLSSDIKRRYPDVQWRDIKDLRNLLIHQYFGVDRAIIWRVVKKTYH